MPAPLSGMPRTVKCTKRSTRIFEATAGGDHSCIGSKRCEHLRFLIDHPEERRKMGRNGRALIGSRYSAARFAERYVEIMREVGVGPRESRPPAGAR
jgi:hypothetical protein